MFKILRVDTKARTFETQEMGEYLGLGGRALTSRVVLREVPATCDPLGPKNKLVVAGGVLTGTVAANSGRVSVGCKSPLTGGIKEANSGGAFPHKLARLGYGALIFEDRPATDAPWVVLYIDKDGAHFDTMPELIGKGTYECSDLLRARYGAKAAVMVIGPAGENLRTAASIQFTDPEGHPARAAGRGGVGAVMGSKRIKAVVIDDAGCGTIKPADPERFKVASKKWVEILKTHPVTSQGLPAFGTNILVNIINEVGGMPTKNFRTGQCDHVDAISGETIAALIEKRGGKTRHGCHAGCIIQCSSQYVDKDGKYLTSGFEYETVWALGASSLIKDIDVIASIDRACDDRGLDTIDVGNAIAVAMEGGLLEWGDGESALALVRKVGTGDRYAEILANGAAAMGRALGVTRVPVVKNQALPAYDPRAIKGIGVTYATTPMGADHTAGYAICQNVLGVGGKVDPLSREGQLEISKNLQIATAAVDAAGLCLFVAFAVLDNPDGVPTIAEMVSALIGQPFTVDDVVNLGVSVLHDELTFNKAAGFTAKDDQLPEFFRKERVAPHNAIWDYTAEELQAAKVSID